MIKTYKWAEPEMGPTPDWTIEGENVRPELNWPVLRLDEKNAVKLLRAVDSVHRVLPIREAGQVSIKLWLDPEVAGTALETILPDEDGLFTVDLDLCLEEA